MEEQAENLARAVSAFKLGTSSTANTGNRINIHKAEPLAENVLSAAKGKFIKALGLHAN